MSGLGGLNKAPDGVVIGLELENYTHRHLLGRLAQQYHLPAIAGYTETAAGVGFGQHAK